MQIAPLVSVLQPKVLISAVFPNLEKCFVRTLGETITRGELQELAAGNCRNAALATNTAFPCGEKRA